MTDYLSNIRRFPNGSRSRTLHRLVLCVAGGQVGETVELFCTPLEASNKPRYVRCGTSTMTVTPAPTKIFFSFKNNMPPPRKSSPPPHRGTTTRCLGKKKFENKNKMNNKERGEEPNGPELVCCLTDRWFPLVFVDGFFFFSKISICPTEHFVLQQVRNVARLTRQADWTAGTEIRRSGTG